MKSYLAIKASCIGPNDLLYFYTSTNFFTVILQFHVILAGKKIFNLCSNNMISFNY
jgi:hypothetical protein